MLRKAKLKRGIVAVLIGLSLVMIVGVVAIAIDGGLLLDQKRQLQAAADAAALAAATDLYGRYQANGGVDPDPYPAKTCALSNAAANGYTHDGTTNIVTVNIPPLSGDYRTINGVIKKGYAEVIIQRQQPRGFSGIFGSGNLPVTARSVAMGKWTDINNGILILDPIDSNVLVLSGNGSATVVGAGIVVNSSNPTAAIVVNGGGIANAPTYDICGVPGISAADAVSLKGGTITSGVPPTPDPLRYIPEPDKWALYWRSFGTKKIQGSETLEPGVYHGGINITAGNGDEVILNPGVYYMDEGGFSITGQATVTAVGVMIYNDPAGSDYASNNDIVKLAGGSNLHMSPPTSGIYKGITVFQRRTSGNDLAISGGGGMNITGTFYAAYGRAVLSGSGSNNLMGSQYIVWKATLTGNGTINVSWSADTARARVKITYPTRCRMVFP
ncbi:MAG: pilus assembly protein TadG-related protein [Planctomycetota bacterium]|nr:pilus assembly protein TadG-related protein [Planctomycetota bacterium]